MAATAHPMTDQTEVAARAATLNRPAGAAGGPDLSTELAALAALDIHELRMRWRKLFRKTAPPHLPRHLLLRILAYRIQANLYGDLDRETLRTLERIGKQRAAGDTTPVPPVPEKRSLKPGTELVREHDGVLHRVTVLAEGCAWQGTTYASLSEVARAITGTRWNGPRFFGLRDKPKRSQVADTEAAR